MVVVPLATPVTIPEVLIVATAGDKDAHVPLAMVLDKVEVPPMTVVAVPVIDGKAFTVELGIAMDKSRFAPDEAMSKVPE